MKTAPTALATAIAVLAGAAAASGREISSQFLDHVVAPDAVIRSMDLDGGTLFVCGDFESLGVPTGSFARLDAMTSEVVPTTTKLAGDVCAVLPDGTGGWFVGGEIGAGATSLGGLVHLLLDGTIDPTMPVVANGVRAIERVDDTLVVGGTFALAGGQPRDGLAFIDLPSRSVTSFAPVIDGGVNALAVSGSTIYVGGFFSDVDSANRSNLAAFDTDGALLPWAPDVNGSVATITTLGTTVYVGGWFTSVDGLPRDRIAAISDDGSVNLWTPSFDDGVRAIAIDAGVAYVGGEFGIVDGQPRSRLAALDLETGAVLAWDPSVTAPGLADVDVRSIAVVAQGLVVGGRFTHVGSAARASIAMLDPLTGAPTSWRGDVGGEPRIVADIAGGQVIALGGSFMTTSSVGRAHLAEIDLASGRVTHWDPALHTVFGTNEFRVTGADATETDVYACGSFDDEFGRPQPIVVAIDRLTGAVHPSFVPPTEPADSIAMVIVGHGGSLYVGFDDGAGLGWSGVMKYDAARGGTGTAVLPTNGTVLTLDLTDDSETLFFGGSFLSPRDRVGGIDLATGALTPWGMSFDTGAVETVNVTGGVAHIGGTFRMISGSLRRGTAAIDAMTPTLLDWDADVVGLAEAVHAIDVLEPFVVLGGEFLSTSSEPRFGAAVVARTDAAPSAWGPEFAPSSLTSVAVDDHHLAVAGAFDRIDGTDRPGLAIFPISEGPDCDGDGVSDAEEIIGGSATDCNRDGVPDDCEPDCNGNGVPDDCDVFSGTSTDCNANGYPDECDVLVTSEDCNANLIPDECEGTVEVVIDSGLLEPVIGEQPHAVMETNVRAATSAVRFEFEANADLDSNSENVAVFLNGRPFVTVFGTDGGSCGPTTVVSFEEPAIDFNGYLDGNTLSVLLVPSISVDEGKCPRSFMRMRITYTVAGTNDGNDDGVPDDCPCTADFDADGVIGFLDLIATLSAWGPCGGCAEDLDGDDLVGFVDLVAILGSWGACP